MQRNGLASFEVASSRTEQNLRACSDTGNDIGDPISVDVTDRIGVDILAGQQGIVGAENTGALVKENKKPNGACDNIG